jgi:nicotinamide-nucleotide amidase
LIKIIVTGSEILQGQVVDTNSSYISERLTSLGYEVSERTVVGDNPKDIKKNLRKYLKEKTKIVIFIGGLGPTTDDITKESVAEELKIPLYKNKKVLKDIESYFKKRGFCLSPVTEKQAMIPQGTVILKNDLGTAPGLIIKTKINVIALLPGPPREFISMVEKGFLPYVKAKCPLKIKIKYRLIRTTGIGESQIQEKLAGIKKSKKINLGFMATPGGVDIKLNFKENDNKEYQKILVKIKKLLKSYIYTPGNKNLEEIIDDLLVKNKKSLSVAESCTGGLIAGRITDVPGSSRYFRMGVVAYSNKSKADILKVNRKSLISYGAVSEQVAGEMAEGIKKTSGSDIALSVTGIAGPGGGTKKKPVGLVYIALVSGRKKEVKKFVFPGDRKYIKFKISQAALDMIRQSLLR